MTNEEAIKMLKSKMDGHTDTSYEWAETVRMAIKALESQPCKDAISRQAVLDKLNRLIEVERLQGTDEMGYGRERVSAYENMIFEINSEYLYPTIQPQPKTGHWIDIMVEDMPAQACDRCSTFYPLAYTGGGHKYCPNCGAKMVEPQESEDKE